MDITECLEEPLWAKEGKASKAGYQSCPWITRPRPAIDRVSSAWLISCFSDPNANFIFGSDPSAYAKAVPLAMYQGDGFGPVEDRCTLETLCSSYAIGNKKVRLIAEPIHDPDLEYGQVRALRRADDQPKFCRGGTPQESLR